MGKAADEISFSDATGLLDILIRTMDGKIDELFDLSTLPRKMMEIERKYRLAQNEDDVGMAISKFFSQIWELLNGEATGGERIVSLHRFITFVGVDQYFVVQKNESEFVFRYRVGANRSPQLTLKFQTKQGSNLIRGELNLNVKEEEPEKIRAFMAVICLLGDSHQLFTVQQSGNIWILKEPDGNLVEIVAYRVDRAPLSQQVGDFVEIEPLNSPNIEGAVATIKKYEEILSLTELVCEESIADMFRPQ